MKPNTNRFSFDDTQIGRLKDTGRSIDDRSHGIRRPVGLGMNEWRMHASLVVNLLNKLEAMRQPLQGLVDLYVANPGIEGSEFIACITPQHSADLSKAGRKKCRIWSAWDAARKSLILP